MVYYGDAARLDPAADPLPRAHHYRFVHYVLRMVAFARPIDCLGAFATDAKPFVEHLWSMLLACCPDEGEPEFGPDAISVHVARLGEFPCAVVQMPPPRHRTEAHFAALVLPIALEALGTPPDPVPLRFFTLEHGIALDGDRTLTMFCEWTRDGAHVNAGEGPAPELEAFLAGIAVHLGANR